MKTEGLRCKSFEISYNLLNSKANESKILIEDVIDRLGVECIIINVEKSENYSIENLDFYIMIQNDQFMKLNRLKLKYGKNNKKYRFVH